MQNSLKGDKSTVQLGDPSWIQFASDHYFMTPSNQYIVTQILKNPQSLVTSNVLPSFATGLQFVSGLTNALFHIWINVDFKRGHPYAEGVYEDRC